MQKKDIIILIYNTLLSLLIIAYVFLGGFDDEELLYFGTVFFIHLPNHYLTKKIYVQKPLNIYYHAFIIAVIFVIFLKGFALYWKYVLAMVWIIEVIYLNILVSFYKKNQNLSSKDKIQDIELQSFRQELYGLLDEAQFATVFEKIQASDYEYEKATLNNLIYEVIENNQGQKMQQQVRAFILTLQSKTIS